MPKYEPINAGVSFKASSSDLIAFQWETNGISADFILPDDETHALRVSFDRPCIVRLLDEMPLSTEQEETPNEGRVPENFAYRVDGAGFASAQSETWKEVSGPVVHYQFVTGWGCMDVMCSGSPTFATVSVPASGSLSYR